MRTHRGSVILGYTQCVIQNATQQQSRTTVEKWSHKQVHFRITDTWVKVTLVLDRCSSQLRKSCAVANMVYSRAECIFILRYYFVSESFAVLREAFINVYTDKEIPNKTTVHRLYPVSPKNDPDAKRGVENSPLATPRDWYRGNCTCLTFIRCA
jgi:hypothetical protein